MVSKSKRRHRVVVQRDRARCACGWVSRYSIFQTRLHNWGRVHIARYRSLP